MSETKQRLNLIIRGHIRRTFENTLFYDFLCEMEKRFTLSIYIHTWTLAECESNWRNIDQDARKCGVSEMMIRDYFKDKVKYIRNMTIEDDENIELYGNLEGRIANTYMPVKSWKRFIYGLKRSMQIVHEDDRIHPSLNIRFDMIQYRYFSTWHGFNFDNMVANFMSYIDSRRIGNPNFRRVNTIGPNRSWYDNCLYGKYDIFVNLFETLHTKLDQIIDTYEGNVRSQEFIVKDVVDNINKKLNFYDYKFI